MDNKMYTISNFQKTIKCIRFPNPNYRIPYDINTPDIGNLSQIFFRGLIS
jgi:hypothetical protein